MRKSILFGCFSVVVLVALAGVSFADVPHLISYQGRLTDGGGTPLTGSHNITFQLYDAASGGTLLWTETHAGVTLNAEGLYNVMLGSVTPFLSSVDFSQQYWLAVSVDGGAEICRYELGASPYALNIADTIRKAATQVFTGATSTALKIDSPGGIGAYILSSDNDGMRIVSPGDDGIAIAGGSSTKRGMNIYNLSGAGEPDTGIVVRKTQYVGILIDSTNSSTGDGIRIERVGGKGIQIDSPGDDGVYIWRPGGEGVEIDSAGGNGLSIWNPANTGVNIVSPGGTGVYVYGAVSSGIVVENSEYNGISVWSSAHDGIDIFTPDSNGIEIEGGNSTARGIFIHNYSGTGNPDTGIVIRDAGDDGIYIDHPGDNGLRIQNPDGMGVRVYNSGLDGAYIYNPDSSGYYTVYPGKAGLEVAGGVDSKYGVLIYDRTGTGDPDTGIVIRDVQDVGILIDSTNSSSGDGIRINKVGHYGVQITSPGNDGLHVSSPGNFGVFIYSSGDDGMYIYEPGNDGVDVRFPTGNCFVCNGSPVSLFRVSNTCEVYSHSYNQYIVDNEGVGYVAPMSATTERWLEHIGEGKIVDGKCRIDLPKDFLESTTIDKENPMRVFITPTSPMQSYWVEQKNSYFTIHCKNASDGATFNYKVHAKIHGFENKKIAPVDLSDYNDNDEKN